MSTIAAPEALFEALDERTQIILERRRLGSSVHRRGWLVRRALLAADVAGLTTAFLIAQRLYEVRSGAHDQVSQVMEFATFAVSLPVWIVGAKVYGLYDKDEERTDHSTTDDFARVFHLVTVCTFLLYAGSHLTAWFSPPFSKLFVFWILAVAVTPVLRACARAYCRRQLAYLQNTIIVGAGSVGQTIARKLLGHPEYGINLVGFVDGTPKERQPGLDHLTLLGEMDDLPDLIKLLDVERVIYAFSNEPHDVSLQMIRRLNELDVQVDVVPRFFEVLSPGVDVHTIEGLPMWSVPRTRLARSSRALKRTIDIGGAIFGLVVFTPLFFVLALAIKCDSTGPVFFRQSRVGTGAKTFRIWKFRTMTIDADEKKHAVAHLNKHLAPGRDSRMFKIDDDPRVTRVGRTLRRWSLDELPQLFNVLRGEMSLVGARPLILDEHQHVANWAHRRLDLKPGLTGLWQVLGRDEIGFDEMVKLDYLYVTTWSLQNDLKLICRTVPKVFAKSAKT